MNKATVTVFASLLVLAISTQNLAGQNSKAEERERAQKAAVAFQEIMGAPDQGIPQELLDRAQCVAVFPSVKKGGFIVGGQYGKGLISCRRAQGSWGSPAYFTIGGGSFGLQIGGQAVDLVLLVMNKSGVEGLLQDKFEIGAGAAVSAGPVGQRACIDRRPAQVPNYFLFAQPGAFWRVGVEGRRDHTGQVGQQGHLRTGDFRARNHC